MTAKVSRRLARSFLRYLRERVGDTAYEASAASLPPGPAQLMRDPGAAGDWVALDDWLPVLRELEHRFGDPSTLQLLRETTRFCMAVAVAKGWSAFLADVTPDLLLQRSSSFWQMSYSEGQLIVVSRASKHCRLAIDGWKDPPPEVVASVAEACVVFLVRLGDRNGRAVEQRADGRVEIDITW
jgi:hypothetical protein